MDESLRRLAGGYASENGDGASLRERVRSLYEHYVKNREQSLIDAVAAAAGISGVVLSNDFTPDQLTPQMREAFELAYPDVPLESLTDRTSGELMQFVSAWKGKLFEVIVRDELNSGNWVGEMHLAPGQFAELAEHANQPGWDLAIINSDGSLADQLQLKATTSLQYVKEALDRYPDINVLTTDEVAERGADMLRNVMNTGVSEEALRNNVESAMSPLLHEAQDSDWLQEVLPTLPFVIIAVSEGARVIMGKASFERAAANATERSVVSGAAMGVGLLIHAVDGGLVTLPATMGARIALNRFFNLRRLDRDLKQKIEFVRSIAPPPECAGLLAAHRLE